MRKRRLPGLLLYVVLLGCGDWVCHRHLGTTRGEPEGWKEGWGEAPRPDAATDPPALELLPLSTSYHG